MYLHSISICCNGPFPPIQAASAAYIIFIIAVYWMTEALPLVVTSLLPLILFPVLGVLSAKEVAVTYLNDTNWLFAGGLMVAIAVEKWDLHKRLALWVLLLMGSRPSMCVCASHVPVVIVYYPRLPATYVG